MSVPLLSVIIASATGVAGFLIGTFKAGLTAYAVEKGKNFATKEDVAEIERELETVRAESQAHQLTNRTQYEIELAAYKDVWSSLVPILRATQSLRPALGAMAANDAADRQRQEERLEAFVETYEPFAAVVWKHRPFYPRVVFDELSTLLNLFRREAIEYRHHDSKKNDQDYWDLAMKNASAITGQVDRVCEVVRERLSSARVTDR